MGVTSLFQSPAVRAFRSPAYWSQALSLRVVFGAFLAALGALWLLTELVQFFDWAFAVAWLKERWWAFMLGACAWVMWEHWPKHTVSCTLTNRDVKIEIRVGNIFDGNAAIIVGCNTSFDTAMDNGIISPRSIQGQFTNRFYTNVGHLDADINTALGQAHAPQPLATVAKNGKPAIYGIGTTVKVAPKGRTAYLCAIAHMNAQGNAFATFDDLKSALPELWDQISTSGDHGNISVPVLGSGLARVAQNRETLIQEILRSFIAACAAQRPCATLSVVIHPNDFYGLNMNLSELGSFLVHLCKYTDFAAAGATGRGLAAPAVPQAATPSTTHTAVGLQQP
jgi:hypothetical protein